MQIQAEQINVSLGGKQIVKELSLIAKEHAFTALLGPNGSGKSTFLKTVYRVLKADSGTIYLGKDSLACIPARKAAQKMAVVSQFHSVNFDYSVEEMVKMGRAPHLGWMKAETPADLEITHQSLELVGMRHDSKRRFSTLSGGEKQRVLLARALAQQPQVLILDEPTNHLDIRYQLEMLSSIRSLGITVLAALHDLSLAAQYCDYLFLLKDGRVHCHGTAREVITPTHIQEVYQVSCDVFDSPIDGRLMIQYHDTPAQDILSFK